MTTLDKIESVAHGLLLFDGIKKVNLSVPIDDRYIFFQELVDEYGETFLSLFKTDLHRPTNITLHNVSFEINFV